MRWIAMALGLFSLQAQIKLARLMQYRIDFAVGVLTSLGLSAMAPLFQLLIYSRTNGYPGWNFDQILVFQGVLLLTSGLREFLFGDVRQQITQLMEKGEFDRLLLKPFPPLLLILTSGFSPYTLGTILVGIGSLGWAWAHAGLDPGASGIALFLVLLVVSALLSLSASILYCVLAVRWIYPMRLDETIDKVLRFGEFPLQAYPLLLRTVFLTVLPFSVATYWPAQALLGRLDPSLLVAVTGAVALYLFMAWCWRRQLERYTSAGG